MSVQIVRQSFLSNILDRGSKSAMMVINGGHGDCQVEVEDKMQKGDVVVFGRPNGEKTEAIVVKVNRQTVLLETTEARGTLRVREAGRKWRVPNDPRFVTVIVSGAEAVKRFFEARQRLAAGAAEHMPR
jgi:hypothetical protein